MVEINILKDFSETLGGRYIKEGPYSGELFRDTILIHKLNEAESSGEKLKIDFDGCLGIGTSFLEESFGGLVRKYHKHGLLDEMILVATEDETIPENIAKYITEAEAKDN